MLKSYRIFIMAAIFLIMTAAVSGEAISIDVHFDPDRLEIKKAEGFCRVWYDDINAFSFAREGDPDLPAFMLRVLIPENTSVSGITANESERSFIGRFAPYPFQGYEIISKPGRNFIQPNKGVYGSGLVYPSERIILQSTGRIRGFNVLYFAYCPFEYDTSADELYLYKDLGFEIFLEYADEKELAKYRGNSVFNGMVRSLVENPEDLELFYPSKLDLNRKATDYDMLIITTDSLKPAVETYASFREESGISSVILTVSDISSSYSGETVQLKIKNCISQYVQNNNITYVFLVGDGGDNSTYSVPDQNVYGYLDFKKESDNTLPGDVFYTCFDSQFDWDADNDGRLGEMNVDNADISPDVIIGRLAVRTQQQILDYLSKVDEYNESVHLPEFAENMLLSGVMLWTSGDAEAKSEMMYSEFIQPYWPVHNKYTLYDSVTTVSVSTLSNLLNQGMNLFHMATHGGVTVWGMESGADFYSSDALALDNTPGIIITIACTSNAFDPEVSSPSDPCMGEAFVRNANGGSVIYIGASRYGIGTYAHDQHGPSFSYDDWIFRYVLEDTYQHNIGAAFTQSKVQLVGTANSDYSFRWVHFCHNLLGDPSIEANTSVLIEGPHPVYNNFSIDDSEGNNNGLPNIGETFDLDINLKNLGNQAAINLNGVLSSDSQYVTILQDNSDYPSIPSGGNAYNNSPYKIQISGDCPHGTNVQFTLDWTCTLGSGTFDFDMRITSENILSIGSGNSTVDYAPLYTYYHDNRTQVIYRASELGGFPSTMHALSIYVAELPGMVLNNWTIRLKHTSKQDYDTSAVFESTGWTVVYQNNETISQTGWVEFIFSTPFEYNGTDNLMVDLSFNNSSWTYEYGECYWSSTSNKRSIYAYTDSYNGDPLDWASGNSPSVYSLSSIINMEIIITLDNPPEGVELDYFTAEASGSQVSISWGTLSEVDLLGWNIYRQSARKVSPFVSYPPVKLNSSLLPGQGGPSEPFDYQYSDLIVAGRPFFYILEAVYAGSGSETWKIRMVYN